jgi:hypothetical protein
MTQLQNSTLTETCQEEYAGSHSNLLSMLEQLSDMVADAPCPETASYTDMAEMLRLENEIAPIWERLNSILESVQS